MTHTRTYSRRAPAFPTYRPYALHALSSSSRPTPYMHCRIAAAEKPYPYNPLGARTIRSGSPYLRGMCGCEHSSPYRHLPVAPYRSQGI